VLQPQNPKPCKDKGFSENIVMIRPGLIIRTILTIFLAISLMALYLSTMAPGLTWANYGADGGEFIAAVATGGVPHPSGYPLYMLIARLFQFLPVGSLAFRTNLLSATATVAAAVLVFQLMVKALPLLNGGPNYLAALASAYAFGCGPLIWSQAVITEVYGLHILFVILILFLSSREPISPGISSYLDLGLGLAFGLGLANNITTSLLLPLLCSGLGGGSSRLYPVLRRAAGLATGLLVYMILPLRALQNPPINWGNPRTWDGFLWLVTGGSYRSELLSLAPALVVERIRATAAILLDQAGLPGLILAMVGLIFFHKASTLSRNTIWIMTAFTAFSLTYATFDSFVYLIPVCLGFAIWIGIGLAGTQAVLPERFIGFRSIVGLAFIIFLVFLAGNHRNLVDASRDMRAETFGREVLRRAPQNGIVFAEGDEAVFTLWYFHFALKQRTDLAIIATDLLQFDWYQENLRTTYPELRLPESFPFAEMVVASNPHRPVCFVEYTGRTQMQCTTAYTQPGNFSCMGYGCGQ